MRAYRKHRGKKEKHQWQEWYFLEYVSNSIHLRKTWGETFVRRFSYLTKKALKWNYTESEKIQCMIVPRTKQEKAMAPHSSTLAWKIPWTEEPGGLQSMGSLRVGHDWATSLSLLTFMHWRRRWQPTPVFLPGESQGRGSLVGCRPWGHTESDTTEVT